MILTRINCVFDEQELNVLKTVIHGVLNKDKDSIQVDLKDLNMVWDKILEHAYRKEIDIESPFGTVVDTF